MITLYFFLLAWLVFLGLYGIMSLVSVLQMVRYGIAGSGTWLSTVVFLVVAFLVMLASGWYFLGVDWQQPVNAFGWLGASVIFGT